MSNTLNLGTDGNWAVKKDSLLAYNSENGNFKPLPFDFTRASSATVVNKDGLIEIVGSGEPRIDFKDDVKGALLLEPTRSNLITYSEAFDNAYWTKSGASVTSGQLSPKGDLSAFKVVESASAGVHRVIATSISSTNGSLYTLQIFAKAEDRNWLHFIDNLGGDASSVFVDLENGVFGTIGLNVSNTSITSLVDGWKKITFTVPAQTTTIQMQLRVSTGNNVTSYTGNGTSGIYIYGAQLEQGSYPTSYIPTQGSAVTRVADVAVKTNISTNIISSSYPFTMYVESENIVGNRYAFCFLNSSVSNNYFNVFVDNDNIVKSESRANGTTENIISGVTLTNGQRFKAAFTMENATSGKLSVNGNIVSKTNFANQSTNVDINDLLIGQLRVISDIGERLPIYDARVYNTALTDSELQALTTI
tara:strand:- start:2 stop:1258 length:1257 start_codon:yes stop_codon:yes gene_type:complete